MDVNPLKMSYVNGTAFQAKTEQMKLFCEAVKAIFLGKDSIPKHGINTKSCLAKPLSISVHLFSTKLSSFSTVEWLHTRLFLVSPEALQRPPATCLPYPLNWIPLRPLQRHWELQILRGTETILRPLGSILNTPGTLWNPLKSSWDAMEFSSNLQSPFVTLWDSPKTLSSWNAPKTSDTPVRPPPETPCMSCWIFKTCFNIAMIFVPKLNTVSK